MGMDIGGTPVGGGSEIAVHRMDRDRVAVCRDIALSRAVESLPAHVSSVAGVGEGGSVEGSQNLQERQQEGNHHQGQAKQHRKSGAAFIPFPVGHPEKQMDQEHRQPGGQEQGGIDQQLPEGPGGTMRWPRVSSL